MKGVSVYRTIFMQVILGIVYLLLLLAAFTLFSYKAPKGALAMSALADAAVASFLVEAVYGALFGTIFDVPFLNGIAVSNGALSGVAAATLVCLKLKVKPVNAVLIGICMMNFGILPGFLAGYFISFLANWIEEKVSDGLDSFAIMVIALPIAYSIAAVSAPTVDALLAQIGNIIEAASTSSPIVMGFILGGIFTVVSTAPLSSMALTAMMGLTGKPMAIAGLAIFSTLTANYILFSKSGIGTREESISFALEPLTQAHLVSANPLVVFPTSFLAGGFAGIYVALTDLVNNTPGTASVIPGIIAPFADNPPLEVVKAGAVSLIIGVVVAFIMAHLSRNMKVVTTKELLKDEA